MYLPLRARYLLSGIDKDPGLVEVAYHPGIWKLPGWRMPYKPFIDLSIQEVGALRTLHLVMTREGITYIVLESFVI